jgi:hypothetical protein
MLYIVMIDDEYMHMFTKRLAQFLRESGGQHYVSMVLRYCLPADALCTLGHMTDRGCDTPVEFFCSPLPVCRARRAMLRRETNSVLSLP